MSNQQIHNSDEQSSVVFTGHVVVDDKGDKIGKVTDVIYDTRTQQPRWLVVDPGLLHSAHFMPASAAYLAEDGKIVSKFAKQTVLHSIKTKGDHLITPNDERELEAYYA